MARGRFKKRTSLPRTAMDQMTPLQVAAYEDAGNVFRSARGAPHAGRDIVDPKTGIERNPRTGLSTESSWRGFFGDKQDINPVTRQSENVWGLHGKEVEGSSPPVRPAPVVEQQPQVLPAGLEGGQAQAWDRGGAPTAVPGTAGAGPTTSGTSFASKYGTGFVRNAGDPVQPFASTSDLTTPDGLMSDANNIYSQFAGTPGLPSLPPPPASPFEEDL